MPRRAKGFETRNALILLVLMAVYWISVATAAEVGQPASKPDHSEVPKGPPQLLLQLGHSAPVTQVAFAPMGRLVTAGGDGTIRKWRVSDRMLELVLPPNDAGFQAIGLSPKGDRAVTLEAERNWRLWDLTQGKVLRQLEKPPAIRYGPAGAQRIYGWAPTGLQLIHFSPDGKWITAVDGRRVLVWWQRDGRLSRILPYPWDVTSAAFSPSGDLYATGDENHEAKVWDTGSWKLLTSIKDHQYTVGSLAFSPDGERLATASYGKVKVFDARTGALSKEVRKGGTFSGIGSIAFSRDGTMIGGTGESHVKFWDIDTGTEVTDYGGFATSPLCFAHSPDGNQMAAGYDDSEILLWDTSTKKAQSQLHGDPHWIENAAMNRDCRWVAAVAGDTARVVRLVSPIVRELDVRISEGATAIALSPTGTQTVTDGYAGLVVWDTVSGKQVKRLQDGDSFTHSIAFAPDGTQFATASHLDDGEAGHLGGVELWRTRSGKTGDKQWNRVWGIDDILYFRSLGFSPDGTRLAGGLADGDLTFWNTMTGKRLKSPAWKKGTCTIPFAFSPNGKMIATAGEYSESSDQVKVWDARSGRLLRRFARLTGALQRIAYSHKGALIGTAQADGTITIRNATTGNVRTPIKGHRSEIRAIGFTADDRRLVSVSTDNSVKHWEVSSGKLLLTFRVLPPTRYDKPAADWIAVTPDGFYDGSKRGRDFVTWRQEGQVISTHELRLKYHQPSRIRTILQ